MLAAPLAAPRPPRTRIPSLIVAGLLHAALFGLILYNQPASMAEPIGAPIMVSFITPARVEPPAPEPPKPIVKPQPKPVVKKPKLKPIITSKRSEPAPFVAPHEPTPEPEIEEAPPPPPPAPKAAAEAPVEPDPPRFNADYLRNPKPSYPSLSRRMHEEGTVVLRVYVSPHGAPERVELNKSSGHARLDESALETIKQHWKFVPARRGNTPVGGWVLVPIAFTLQG